MRRKKNGERPAGKETGKTDTGVMSDIVAEALEAAGLYRRAARRWLEVLDRCRDSEERAWLASRRCQCLEKARKPEPAAERFGDVCQAASDTQKRMGIRTQETFRQYPGKGSSC
ncbi:PerC family transcriptional regulator [Salmonella enterica]|nr:PerC family transcriptional regulator [Salmonella enterica]ECN5820927.1 PerC family transcriptional regulator [Salmonella enterica subsp. enterica serovar Infantis]EDW6859439.1 PerC family transcriptional regulator [Salmonella enterica]EEJ5736128.1 PerC family transcriptional regulator [Salmonella enterica]